MSLICVGQDVLAGLLGVFCIVGGTALVVACLRGGLRVVTFLLGKVFPANNSDTMVDVWGARVMFLILLAYGVFIVYLLGPPLAVRIWGCETCHPETCQHEGGGS